MSNELWIGLVAAVGSSVLFGTVFVPVKKVDAGDGFSAQMFMCIGGFLTSIFIHFLLGFPSMQGFAMIGGAAWGVANAVVLQIMKRLGLALSSLVWNTVSCITGWATSRYGLLGLPAAVPASAVLNYVGIFLLVVGGVMYMLVKNNDQEITQETEKGKMNQMTIDDNEKTEDGISRTERAISFIAAMICGVIFGSVWTPVTYMRSHMDEFPDAPSDSISYEFSFYCGGFCTTVCAFIIYTLVMKNEPWINPSGAVPAMLGGAVFAAALGAFVIAVDNLDQAIAYPICTMAPGLVVLSWSIFYFKEITGRRNLTWLASAYCLTLIGVILVAVSKECSFY